MARFVTGIFLAACVALVFSNDETLDELEQLLENLESRRNLNAFEDPQAFGNMEALDNPETRGNLNAFEDPHAFNNMGAFDSMGTLDNPETRGNPESFEDPQVFDNMEALDNMGALDNPNTRGNLNAFEDPQAFNNMEAFDNMRALDNPETRGNQGEFDDLETNDDFETLENLESLDNMEARENMDAFEDMEAFDDMHAIGDLDLETSEKLEARGHEKTYDNMESLENLGVLDKRMMQERMIQLEGVEEFIDKKLEEMKDKLVEGFSGQEGSVSYKISNIKISNIQVDLNPAVQFKDGFSRADLTVTLPTFTVDADWWARYKTWLMRITRDGSLTATANRVTVTVTASLSPLKVEDCRANADISVKVHGGGLVTKILLLFKKSSFVNALEEKLEDALKKSLFIAWASFRNVPANGTIGDPRTHDMTYVMLSTNFEEHPSFRTKKFNMTQDIKKIN